MELLSSYLVNLKIKIFLNLKDGDPLAPAARELSVADLSRDSTRSRGVRGGRSPTETVYNVYEQDANTNHSSHLGAMATPRPSPQGKGEPWGSSPRLRSTAQVWLGIPMAAPHCGAPSPSSIATPHCSPSLCALAPTQCCPPLPSAICGLRFAACLLQLVCCSLLLIAARCVRACARVRGRGRVRACVALKRSFRFKKILIFKFTK